MGHLEKLRILIGILKDKTSLIKTRLSTTSRHTYSIRRAILRATTHDAHSPPPDYRIDAVLSFGHGSPPAAGTCIGSLMDRLHGTHNASVALKCLFTIHNIIARGSFVLKDQISFYPSYGGRNFLNLSTFLDDRDPETWEYSLWVRWYAVVLEQNFTVSRVLGYYLGSSEYKSKKEEKVSATLDSDSLTELDALVGFVEEISRSPKSLHLQRNDLIYEVVRLVSEDYRLLQREITLRVEEFGETMARLSHDELTHLLNAAEKLEECKERLSSLFANRKKNDGFWLLISETKMKVMAEMNRRADEKAMVRICRGNESSELNRVGERFPELGQFFRFTTLVVDGWA